MVTFSSYRAYMRIRSEGRLHIQISSTTRFCFTLSSSWSWSFNARLAVQFLDPPHLQVNSESFINWFHNISLQLIKWNKSQQSEAGQSSQASSKSFYLLYNVNRYDRYLQTRNHQFSLFLHQPIKTTSPSSIGQRKGSSASNHLAEISALFLYMSQDKLRNEMKSKLPLEMLTPALNTNLWW